MKREKKTARSFWNKSINWKLFGFLVAFLAFAVATVLFFQVMMLENFYKKAKRDELERISFMLSEYVGSEELGDAVYSCAVDYTTCIRVFKFNSANVATEVASADVSADCIIHNIKKAELNDKLNDYYQLALKNRGVFTEAEEIKSKMGFFWSTVKKDYPMQDRIKPKATSLSMVYNKIAKDENGEVYMILLNSELTPVDATVSTLKMQFYAIVSVMIAGAFILAVFISKNISSPLKKMSGAAKKLSEGRYDADFSVKGYREIEELSESLSDAADKLSRLDNLQKELIANVSHDLRTPLTLIKGYGELMRDIPEENTPENLQAVVDEVDHLCMLVNDVLDLSRIHSGARTPEFTVFNLTEAIRAVMERYHKLVNLNGYKINFFADCDVYIHADKMMIIQVVYNLINNAVNYSGEDKTVKVIQKVENKIVRITVEDNGEGIPPEKLDNIWERYYKVDKVHKRATVGTGLGLFIVKSSLEAHKATYGVNSALGHGSSFWFELPLADIIMEIEGEE